MVAVQINPTDPRTWLAAVRATGSGGVAVSSQMPDHIRHLSGFSARDYYTNPRSQAAAAAAVAAYYRLTAAPVAGELYNYEAEALGAPMIYGENAMPTIDFRQPLIQAPADLEKIRQPADWLSAGRVRFAWETARLLNEGSPANVLVCCAPFSMAVGLRSYPLLIRDMRRNPAFARDLFTRLVDDIMPSYLKAYADYLGGAVLAYGADAWSAYPNLSPEWHEEWIVPYAMRLMQNTMKLGFPTLLGVSADYCEEDLSKFDKQILWKTLDQQVKLMMGKPAINIVMGRTDEFPMEPIVEWLNQWKANSVRASITMGINARLLREGPAEAIVALVKRFIRTFAYDHDLGLMMASVPADTPPDHIHAAVAAAHSYGRLPLAENLDDVEFKMPHRESFAEYVDKMSNGMGLQF